MIDGEGAGRRRGGQKERPEREGRPPHQPRRQHAYLGTLVADHDIVGGVGEHCGEGRTGVGGPELPEHVGNLVPDECRVRGGDAAGKDRLKI